MEGVESPVQELAGESRNATPAHLDELKSDSEAADDAPEAKPAAVFPHTVYVDKFEDAVIKALRAGKRSRDDVFKAARELLGYSRLGPQVRVALADALERLDLRKIVRIEENEVFFFDGAARGGTYVAKNRAITSRTA